MILHRFVLVYGFVLLGQPATAHQSIRNDSREFVLSPGYARMTTFINTDTGVRHMEPDLYTSGKILFTDGCALKTTDGTTTTTIAGHPRICDSYNGIGTLARFGPIFGFRQISPTEVVIVDYANHCLRLLDRITLDTSVYAGFCASQGNSDGTSSARFNYPLYVIDDFKQPGMLIVTQAEGIRHVNKLSTSIPRPVSTFLSSSDSLVWPRCVVQDPITGDMFIGNGKSILKLSYSTKSITTLAGENGVAGNRDCDFSYSRFESPNDIIMISKNMLITADTRNQKLRLMDFDTRTVTSLCLGVQGFSDGDMKTCRLSHPWSLMVLNDTLYVGQSKKIRKVQDSRITACSGQEIRKVASAETGVALVDIPLLAGMVKMQLAPGTYPTEIASEKANCTINIRVKDPMIKRRLVLESKYSVNCDSTTTRSLLDSSSLLQSVDVTYRQLEDVCQPDCSRAEIEVMITCEGDILTVIWPTDIVYNGDVEEVPEDLEEKLNERIEAKGAAFYLFIHGHNPPFVYPNKEDNGGYVTPSIYNFCRDESYMYNKQKDACEKTFS